jgi:hypothetical protein
MNIISSIILTNSKKKKKKKKLLLKLCSEFTVEKKLGDYLHD